MNCRRSGSKTPCAIDRELDAPYRLGYTGGTTGRSKAVTLTMRGELAELSAFLTDLVPEIGEGQTFLHAAPIAHASGAFFLPSLVRGARSLVMAKFDPEEFVQLAAAERAELTFLVPTMLAMVLEAPSIDEAPFALRCIAYGASPIAPAVLERAEARFGRVFAQTYGQAESPMVITCLRPKDHDRIGSCGRPFHDCRGRGLRRRGSTAPGRRARRDRLSRSADDGLLLGQSGGHRGCFPQRVAAHRRHRLHGRGRVLLSRRSQERHADLRRLQRLSARSRGRVAVLRRRRRGGGHRPSRREMGRPRLRGHLRAAAACPRTP